MCHMKLDIKNLEKTFGKRKILDGLNLTVDKGQLIGIYGDNGAGKSTLVKIISGLMNFNKGEILYKGEIITPSSTFQRHHFGILIDPFPLIENIRVVDHIQFSSRLFKIQKEKILSTAEEYCTMFGLRLNSKIKELSSGQKKKLAITISLIHNPDTLIWDEPFNHLDSKSIELVKKVLVNQRMKGNALVISHNTDLLSQFSSNILQLKHGKLKVK